MINCYFLFTKNGRVFSRKGLPCDGMEAKNGLKRIIINGLGRYRLFQEPPSIANGRKSDEELISAVRHYPPSAPWIGCESSGVHYLYAGGVSQNGNLLGQSNAPPNTDYVLLHTPPDADVRVMGNGRILFRRYESERGIAMLELSGCAMILVEDDAMGGGKFICR